MAEQPHKRTDRRIPILGASLEVLLSEFPRASPARGTPIGAATSSHPSERDGLVVLQREDVVSQAQMRQPCDRRR